MSGHRSTGLSFTGELLDSSSSKTRGNIEDGESLMTWHRDGSVRLRLADQGPGSEKPLTVIAMLEDTVKQVPERVALGKWHKERDFKICD